MSKAIYIATTGPYSGKSIISLGLMKVLLGRNRKVGFFRPIIGTAEGERDNNIETVLSYFNIPQDYEDCYSFTGEEVLTLKNEGKTHEIIDAIIGKYKQLEDRFDFMLLEGSDFLGESVAFEFEINASIIQNLGIPIVIVENGFHKSTHQIMANMHMAIDNFRSYDIEAILSVVNKVNKKYAGEVNEQMKLQLGAGMLTGVIPELKQLDSPTLKEIMRAVNGKELFKSNKLDNQAENYLVGAMQLRNYLPLLSEKCLSIAPGDRADIILGTVEAHKSANYPNIAGIVLTGGLTPERPVLKLLEGLPNIPPLILTKINTFEAANTVGSLASRILPENKAKIELAINTFAQCIDISRLEERITTHKTEGITPHMFLYMLVKKAKSNKKHIVLPEGNDDRILIAASRLAAQDIVRLTLLGEEEMIVEGFQRLGLTLEKDRIQILNPATSGLYEDYAHTLYELRKNKNMNLEMAHDLLTDVSYFGTMMVYKGDADGMVSGAAHTTQSTLRPALQIIRTRPASTIVSSVFFMCLEERVAVFGDCAVNPNPTAAQLAEIAVSSAETSEAFGISPKIAMLSYSSGESGKGEEVEKVRKATAIVKSAHPELMVEGPIQYDAAVDAGVGQSKIPGSKVAGQANVLIFPDLNTGNNTYKAVQRETGAIAIGPVLQGLNKPVNDLSRGCTVEDVFNTVVITAIQAQLAENH
jgi:phosphate acetyltransferase